MRCNLLIICALAAWMTMVPAGADEAQPLTLTVSQDQARIADALTVLQQEAGCTIVVDSTVIGRMGSAKVSFPTLPKMLDFLKTMEPGLTYTRVYIAKGRPVPTGQACFDLVRTMQWLSQQGNPIVVTSAGAISLVNDKAPPRAAPPGMREIWYVSDEQVRTQEILDQQKIDRGDLTATSGTKTPSPSQSPVGGNQYPGRGPNQGPINRMHQYQVSPGLVIQR